MLPGPWKSRFTWDSNLRSGKFTWGKRFGHNSSFWDCHPGNCRANLSSETILLRFGITPPNVVIEAKTTKKGNGQLPQRPETTGAGEHFPASGRVVPAADKNERKYLRIILWACLSAVFLGVGCLASGLLSQEESATNAVLLFLAALVGAAGCIFYFYRLLREISPKPKPPFISTLP